MYDGPGPVNQAEKFPVPLETKIRMQLRAGLRTILSGCKDQQVVTRKNLDAGKAPALQLIRIVAQVPALEINSSGTLVLNLNPVGGFAVFIEDSIAILGQELRDHHGLGMQ